MRVWKTDSGWAGACRQPLIELNDGNYQRAKLAQQAAVDLVQPVKLNLDLMVCPGDGTAQAR